MDFKVFHSTSMRKNQTMLEQGRPDIIMHTSERFLLGKNNRSLTFAKKSFKYMQCSKNYLLVHICMCFVSSW